MSQLELRPKVVRRQVAEAAPDTSFFLYGDGGEESAATEAPEYIVSAPSVAKIRLSNSTAAVAATRSRYWSLLDTIAEMSSLPEDHDYALPMETSLYALDIVAKLSERAIDPPRIFASDSDGLTLSWERGELRHYVQVDKADIDHLVVRLGTPKLYCHHPVLGSPAGRNGWLDDFAGPPISSTAEEDVI